MSQNESQHVSASLFGNLSHRQLLVNTGRVAAVGACGCRRSARPCRSERHDPAGARRLRRTRHRAAAMTPSATKNGPHQTRRHGRCLRGPPQATVIRRLRRAIRRQVDVPDERQFIGFDGYKNAMDCLKPGDIAIFTTPPAFRWVHFNYAIEKGLNVFMEKPLTVDGPTTRQDVRARRRSGRART